MTLNGLNSHGPTTVYRSYTVETAVQSVQFWIKYNIPKLELIGSHGQLHGPPLDHVDPRCQRSHLPFGPLLNMVGPQGCPWTRSSTDGHGQPGSMSLYKSLSVRCQSGSVGGAGGFTLRHRQSPNRWDSLMPARQAIVDGHREPAVYYCYRYRAVRRWTPLPNTTAGQHWSVHYRGEATAGPLSISYYYSCAMVHIYTAGSSPWYNLSLAHYSHLMLSVMYRYVRNVQRRSVLIS